MKQLRDEEFIGALAKRLREIRLSKGISQEQLSYSSKLEFSQISRIERGKINTSISQIAAICKALKIQPKELFDFDIDLL